ncbi:hypothetical protein HYV88_06470 [Candidatus Woesearchaeota archaeon]|nr:hypothetical protein [Candidatus Woesearchaeota archaeon]
MSKIAFKNITVESFDPKTISAKLKISFIRENKEDYVNKEFQLRHPLTIVNHIFLATKSKDRILHDRPPSDPLEALEMYSPIKIEDEDKVEEKIISFITDLCLRAKNMTTNKNAVQHMKIINWFKTARLDFVLQQKEKKEHDSTYIKMFKRTMK